MSAKEITMSNIQDLKERIGTSDFELHGVDIHARVLPRVSRESQELKEFVKAQMVSAKEKLERDGRLPVNYFIFGRDCDLIIDEFQVRSKRVARSLLTEIARLREAAAVAEIGDSWLGEPGPPGNLPPGQQREALVAGVRIRKGNEVWYGVMCYERTPAGIRWQQEAEGNVTEMSMIPEWWHGEGPATKPECGSDGQIQPPANRTILYDVMVYHVMDGGRHRFLTMNSLSAKNLGGTDAFEDMLARQYNAFEWLGSTPMAGSEENPEEVTYLDPRGAEQLHDEVRSAMAAHPNSSQRLEPWLPARKEPILPPFDAKKVHLRPMSTLKKEVPDFTLDRIVLAFPDNDIGDLVKPEFADAAVARGGVLLKELKDHVRTIAEASLIRAIEGPGKDDEAG